MRWTLVSLLAVGALGCSPGAASDGGTGGGGGSSGDCRALAQATAVAVPLAQSSLPGGVLNEILGDDLGDDGRVSATGEWTYFFHRAALGPDDFFATHVLPDCSTSGWNPGGAGNATEIPAYTASVEWVDVATTEATAQHVTFNLRLLQVRATESPTDYPGVAHLAYVYFHQAVGGDPGDPLLIVILDADQPRVLGTTR